MRHPVKRHYEARKGVISRPRICTTGTYYIAPEDRRVTKEFEGGAGFTDHREHDWTAWSGLEDVPPSELNNRYREAMIRRRIGFL